MKLVIFGDLAIGTIIFMPMTVFGHKLIPTDGSNNLFDSALWIPDPIVSWAMYEKLDGNVLYYTFDAKKGDLLYASIVIPKLEHLENFTPSLVFIAPSFTIDLIDELKIMEKNDDFPFEIPDGYNAIVFHYNGSIPSNEFYEPLGQITYWERQEINLTIPVDSTYYLAVYDSKNQSGKIAQAVGYVEDFSASDFMTVLPSAWFESRFFVNDYTTPAIALIILLSIPVVIGILIYRKMKK